MTNQRFVVLPTRGFVAHSPFTTAATGAFLLRMDSARHNPGSSGAEMKGVVVLDSIHENGAKLVELTPGSLQTLRRAQPGLRIVPEHFYEPAVLRRPVTAKTTAANRAVAATKMQVTVTGPTGQPVEGAEVLAFTDTANGLGDTKTTSKTGKATLALRGPVVQQLYVTPPHTYWPVLLRNVTVASKTIRLRPIDLAEADSRTICYPNIRNTHGTGVTVGVIDTGVGPHHALNVAGGVSTVQGSDETDWTDSRDHGTHVAGIIAAHAANFTGIAPATTLRAYRVFATTGGGSSFAIAKAIDRAVGDGCDLLNLSLGGTDEDPVISEAIKAARERGVVAVVAAGNDGGPVSWPGADPLAICVSAIGISGAWPSRAAQRASVGKPHGTNDTVFATFSNRGPEIDITAPGVGIVSTVPGDKYAVMDGTSMACPAVTGVLARLLSRTTAVRDMARNPERSDAIVGLAFKHTKNLGMGPTFQGTGLAV